MTSFDLPQQYAGPVIAALATAVTYLMTVDWIHPPNRTKPWSSSDRYRTQPAQPLRRRRP